MGETTKADFKISPPWIGYYRKLEALFGKDPQVKLAYSDDDLEAKIYVDDSEKAYAIAQILPTVVVFGSVKLKITVIPANFEGGKAGFLEKAFEGNPAFKELVQITGVYENPVSYAIFAKEVVQFWNDNLGDPNGIETTLYQDIASEILDVDGVMYTTDSDIR